MKEGDREAFLKVREAMETRSMARGERKMVNYMKKEKKVNVSEG